MLRPDSASKAYPPTDHSRGFDTALIPVQLKGGDNQLVIKTNNKQNTDRLIWVINCCLVED